MSHPIPPDIPAPEESGDEDGSSFADFISRLRPYPRPTGLRQALLLAVAGSLLAFLAALLVGSLPQSENDGFHAVLVAQLETTLEVFRVLVTPFTILGVAGMGITAAVGLGRRISPAAGGALAAVTLIGALACGLALVGWLVYFAFSVASLALWGLVIGLVVAAGVRLLLVDFGGALFLALGAMFLGGVLTQAATDSGPTVTHNRNRHHAQLTRPSSKPQTVPAATRRHLASPRPAALPDYPRRIALEERIAVEYRDWLHNAYLAPCEEDQWRADVRDLHREFVGMEQALRTINPTGRGAIARKASSDLRRVARERHRTGEALFDFYEIYGRCPSPVGVMRYRWTH